MTVLYTNDLVEREINIESILNEYNDMNLNSKKDYYFRIGRYGAWIELSGLDNEISQKSLDASSQTRKQDSSIKNDKSIFPLVIVKKAKNIMQKRKDISEKSNNANLEQNSNDFQFQLCDDTFMSTHTHNKTTAVIKELTNIENRPNHRKILKKDFQSNKLIRKDTQNAGIHPTQEQVTYNTKTNPSNYWIPNKIKKLLYRDTEPKSDKKMPEPGENCVTITQVTEEDNQTNLENNDVTDFSNDPMPINILINEQKDNLDKSE